MPLISETIPLIPASSTILLTSFLTNTILLSGLEIEQELGISNLFDCLHAATAKIHDSVIISDGALYDRVPNLERISLKGFASRRE
jgi:hypothetical protein